MFSEAYAAIPQVLVEQRYTEHVQELFTSLETQHTSNAIKKDPMFMFAMATVICMFVVFYILESCVTGCLKNDGRQVDRHHFAASRYEQRDRSQGTGEEDKLRTSLFKRNAGCPIDFGPLPLCKRAIGSRC